MFDVDDDAEHMHVSKEYSWEDYGRDYGALEIPGATCSEDGFLLPDGGATTPQPGEQIYVAGFPAAGNYKGDRMHHATGLVVDCGCAGGFRERTNRTFCYEVGTAGGLSGGPVWRMAGEKPELIGVHISGQGDYGQARALNGPAHRDLDVWIKPKVCPQARPQRSRISPDPE